MKDLNEHIKFLEMVEDDPQLLCWLLELRRHRENNWQQRAEAAEARANNLNDGWLNAINERDEARAKLAELEKQGRILFNIKLPSDAPDLINLSPEQQTEFNRGFWYGVEKVKRLNPPAPAVSLAELVPDEKIFVKPEFGNDAYAAGRVDGFNACRAEILRKIEEAK